MKVKRHGDNAGLRALKTIQLPTLEENLGVGQGGQTWGSDCHEDGFLFGVMEVPDSYIVVIFIQFFKFAKNH